jgi:hypothetical protein
MNKKLSKLVNLIDKRAFEMAKEVVENPSKRSELNKTAFYLRKKLKSIASELLLNNLTLYEELSGIISDALLDLKFISQGGRSLSKRLILFVADKGNA